MHIHYKKINLYKIQSPSQFFITYPFSNAYFIDRSPVIIKINVYEKNEVKSKIYIIKV